MGLTIREHIAAGLVAAAVIAAGIAQGLFEPSGYAAASIVVWAAVIAGLVSRRLPMTPVSLMVVAAGLCLAATAALAAVSMSWATDQGRAFEEAVRVSLYLGLFALAACTATARARSQWLTGLTVGLVVVSIVALVAYLQPGLLGDQPTDVQNAAGRLAYPIGYWNGAGALLAVAAVLLAYAAVRAPSRGLRCSATAAIPLVLLGVWLANSRGAGVALLIGGVVLIAATADRIRLLRGIVLGSAGAIVLILVTRQMPALTSGTVDSASRSDGDWLSAICVVVFAIVAAAAWLADDWVPRLRLSRAAGLAVGGFALLAVIAALIAANPVHRFNEFKEAPDTNTGVAVAAADLSSNGRWQFWGAALDALEEHPIDGVGAGGYEHWWALHPRAELFARNPHSLPLQQGAELGVPGLLLFAGFVAAVAVAVRRRLAAGLEGDAGVLTAVVATAAVGATVDWTWQIPAVFGPAVVCAGLLLASAPSARTARNGTLLGFGVLAVAWIAIIGSAVVLLAEIELRRSRDAAGDGQVAEAIDRARTARSIEPWSAKPYTQLALLEEQRGDFPAALGYLRQAQDRDSEDWRLYVIEARLHRRSGDTAAGLAATARAELFSPFSLVSLSEAQRQEASR
jgi:O-Antigen ligase